MNSSRSARRFVMAYANTSSVSMNVSRAFLRAIWRYFTNSSQLSVTAHGSILSPDIDISVRLNINRYTYQRVPFTDDHKTALWQFRLYEILRHSVNSKNILRPILRQKLTITFPLHANLKLWHHIKSWLLQLMRIYLKNNWAKFHPDPIWNDRALESLFNHQLN